MARALLGSASTAPGSDPAHHRAAHELAGCGWVAMPGNTSAPTVERGRAWRNERGRRNAGPYPYPTTILT